MVRQANEERESMPPGVPIQGGLLGHGIYRATGADSIGWKRKRRREAAGGLLQREGSLRGGRDGGHGHRQERPLGSAKNQRKAISIFRIVIGGIVHAVSGSPSPSPLSAAFKRYQRRR